MSWRANRFKTTKKNKRQGKQKKPVWEKANVSEKRKKKRINEKDKEKSKLMSEERAERIQCNKNHSNTRNPP